MRFAHPLVRLGPVVVLLLVSTTVARQAWAVGEIITDVAVRENNRTEEDTVRSIAGIDIGDELEATTLERCANGSTMPAFSLM